MPIPRIKQYAIHHTSSSRGAGKSQLNAVNEYHRTKDWGGGYVQDRPSSLGWYVGYNYFIDIDGKITNTRKVGEETIANVGHNCSSDSTCDTISVCLAGDFNKELPTDAQVKALKNLIAELEKTYGKIAYTFHRLIQPSRTCPGTLFTEDYMHKVILEKNTITTDTVDAEKKEKIEALQKQVNYLMELLRKLLNKK